MAPVAIFFTDGRSRYAIKLLRSSLLMWSAYPFLILAGELWSAYWPQKLILIETKVRKTSSLSLTGKTEYSAWRHGGKRVLFNRESKGNNYRSMFSFLVLLRGPCSIQTHTHTPAQCEMHPLPCTITAVAFGPVQLSLYLAFLCLKTLNNISNMPSRPPAQ